MSVGRLLLRVVPWVVVASAIAGAVATRAVWMPWIVPTAKSEEPAEKHGDESTERVKLTPQARANMKLAIGPVHLQTWWKTLTVPGQVADRPGVTDRSVSAPLAGVVQAIHVRTGDTVRPGDRLFDLRVVSEAAQTAQTELFKSARELQLLGDQKARMEQARGTAIPESRFIELDMQISRARTSVHAFRQDLQARGFSPAQITSAEGGSFVTEYSVVAPPFPDPGGLYEIQELKAHLGDFVTAGQSLGMLADHRELIIEGFAFKTDVPALTRATAAATPVTADFVGDDPAVWTTPVGPLRLRHIANSIDPATRTLQVTVPLRNQARTYERDGKTLLLWRFRPGQSVLLRVPLEKLDGVIVLPTEAVIREGADAYAFRVNGDWMERKPVVVLYADQTETVLANDGTLPVGSFVARSAGAAINRAIRSQEPAAGGHDHDH
ncbi:MAG: efflux RND transporter periplasmic adaptor subunit [Gemmataceae bacterium]|nr:efflux RND transporter periplasmic adaptor subunit [Gemmataceae bacterium]